MKIALITPTDTSIRSNPGWFFITNGIKYICDQSFGNNTYYNIPMTSLDEESWEVLNIVDLVIICGNPRFNTDFNECFVDTGIWNKLLYSKAPIIDAWNGSANSIGDLTNEYRIYNLSRIPKTIKLINFAKLCKLVIVRDEILYEILRNKHQNVQFLHCSSWWAKDYYKIENKEKLYNVIVLRELMNDTWIIDYATRLSKELNSAKIIVLSLNDWKWVRNYNKYLDIELINDPIELLELLTKTDKLLSMRLHVSIPGLSLGAKVCNVYQDSRYLTCDKFGFKSTSFWLLKEKDFIPEFNLPTNIPNIDNAISIFKGVI